MMTQIMRQLRGHGIYAPDGRAFAERRLAALTPHGRRRFAAWALEHALRAKRAGRHNAAGAFLEWAALA